MDSQREKIIDSILKSKLVEKCVSYQAMKMPKYIKEEITQETWLWLLSYDIDKLADAFENKHLNALITRYLQNQLNSITSPFYKTYFKNQENFVEITGIIKDTIEDFDTYDKDIKKGKLGICNIDE